MFQRNKSGKKSNLKTKYCIFITNRKKDKFQIDKNKDKTKRIKKMVSNKFWRNFDKEHRF